MAYIVLQATDRISTTEQSELTKAIQEVVASRIGRAATPRTIAYVDHLPMLDSGKVDRLKLRLQANQEIAQGLINHPGTK